MAEARRAWCVTGLALLATACAADGTGTTPARGQSPSGLPEPADEPVQKVVVSRPSIPDETGTLVLPGTVEPWEQVTIHARVTGYLDAVTVEIGDPVKQGETIARILVPDLQARLRGAEARARQERAELDLARLTRRRLTGLHAENPEAVARQEIDIAAAKERIEAAQVALAEAETDRFRTMAGFSRVRAPFDGVVTRRFLDVGALVQQGTSSGAQPIVEIARTDRLRLSFDVPETLGARVVKGDRVLLRFAVFPAEEIEATVSRVSGAINTNTRSFRAEVDLDNAGGRYRPGMYVSVHLRADAIRDALAVPSRAIRGQGGERYCLVVRDGLLERRGVFVASDDGRQALVASGLTLDDRVVVAGSPLVQAGARVEAIEEERR